MNSTDVLKRAVRILTEETLGEANDCQGGQHCPYCAIAQAKTELDEENDTGLSNSECMGQIVAGFGFIETDEDIPLIEAKCIIASSGIRPPFDKDEVIQKITELMIKEQAGM